MEMAKQGLFLVLGWEIFYQMVLPAFLFISIPSLGDVQQPHLLSTVTERAGSETKIFCGSSEEISTTSSRLIMIRRTEAALPIFDPMPSPTEHVAGAGSHWEKG